MKRLLIPMFMLLCAGAALAQDDPMVAAVTAAADKAAAADQFSGVVLVAKYGREGRPKSVRDKDEKARRVLAEHFKGRKIVQIDAENINLGGGGIHCITQQQPTGTGR